VINREGLRNWEVSENGVFCFTILGWNIVRHNRNLTDWNNSRRCFFCSECPNLRTLNIQKLILKIDFFLIIFIFFHSLSYKDKLFSFLFEKIIKTKKKPNLKKNVFKIHWIRATSKRSSIEKNFLHETKYKVILKQLISSLFLSHPMSYIRKIDLTNIHEYEKNLWYPSQFALSVQKCRDNCQLTSNDSLDGSFFFIKNNNFFRKSNNFFYNLKKKTILPFIKNKNCEEFLIYDYIRHKLSLPL
jgi:hypothetical protein